MAKLQGRGFAAWLRACWSAPICSSTGALLGTFANYYTKVCEPKADELALIQSFTRIATVAIERSRADEALRRSERKFAAVFNQQSQFMAIMTPEGIIEECNHAAFRDTGIARSEVAGRHFWDTPWWRDLPDMQKLWRDGFRQVVATRIAVTGEGTYMLADGNVHSANYAISAVTDEHGEVAHVVVEARDITRRKQAAQHRELLINELNHRVKNTLASVQSIASQTFRSGASGESAPAFQGRLIALAETHDLLTDQNWEGTGLRNIVLRTVALHDVGPHGRFAVEGPDVRLPPRRALAFAMAFHELAANAGKYGALSNDIGSVAVEWSEAGGKLSLRWTERNGPAVVKPARLGFGSRLIERGLSHELGGEVRLDFRPDGLVCSFDLPMRASQPASPSAAGQPAT